MKKRFPALLIAAARVLNAQLEAGMPALDHPDFLRRAYARDINPRKPGLHPDIVRCLSYVLTRDPTPTRGALEAYGRLLLETEGRFYGEEQTRRAYIKAHRQFRDLAVTPTLAMPGVLRRKLRSPEFPPERLSEAVELWLLMLRYTRTQYIAGKPVRTPVRTASMEMTDMIEASVRRANLVRVAPVIRDYEQKRRHQSAKATRRRQHQLLEVAHRFGARTVEALGRMLPPAEMAQLRVNTPVSVLYTDLMLQQHITISHGRQGYMTTKIGETMKLQPDDYETQKMEVTRRVLGDDFSGIIGLSAAKEEFRQLRASVLHARALDILGYRDGESGETDSYHLVFSGPPGTAKTTFARQAGMLYKQLGILEEGHVVEAKRSDLVAGYLGQTAIKTKALIEKAYDGVLFIDEAYQLFSTSSNDYGREAVAELMVAMENDRDRLVVIFAGYPDDMEQMLEMNPGLISRFRARINFPAYSEDELHAIFEQKARENHIDFTDEAMAAVKKKINEARAETEPNRFGNGRYVRSLLRAVTDAMARRLVREGALNCLLNADAEEAAGTLRRTFAGQASKRLVTPTVEDVRAASVPAAVKSARGHAYSGASIGFGARLRA